ncbi:metallopeptidase MepB [Sporothrix schenckii 1099-18]|uniref:Metallopeptidase MepB n=1 Tax=Sporothrix schenckii 1099-18 TaxID=1397361 RepID=A0A0F2M0Z9_SPOSC|nr:metallopeptidase MepB [Sporothrix schenckii 1099-18]KJR82759.1 metallopeptidase MepB [Sporothrix schenckii 1099-18]
MTASTSTHPSSSLSFYRTRPFHSSATVTTPSTTSPRTADVVPIYGQGPPPNAPEPQAGTSAENTKEASTKATDLVRDAEERAIRISRRKALADKVNGASSSRFWKNASVEEVGEHLEVRLDTRAVRHPTTKKIIQIPAHKKMLAHALATEWDLLASARQATQGHRVPLTSLVCRAIDLEDEKTAAAGGGAAPMRTALIENLLRYLDTDSLLCWAPPDELASLHGIGGAATRNVAGHGEVTLRQLQERMAEPILAYMAAHVWPGVVVEPVLGGADQASLLFPKPHPAETRKAVADWLESLNGWDLAGVERATLAGKSMVVASRFVAGWSQTAVHPAPANARSSALSVEAAYAATNMETAFQTAQWGEVEDTHDVDQADMRRHFGSVVLLVS